MRSRYVRTLDFVFSSREKLERADYRRYSVENNGRFFLSSAGLRKYKAFSLRMFKRRLFARTITRVHRKRVCFKSSRTVKLEAIVGKSTVYGPFKVHKGGGGWV